VRKVESGVPPRSRFSGQGQHLGPTLNTPSVEDYISPTPFTSI